MSSWQRVNRRDRAACVLADRHYSRQVVGAPQVGGNARLLILLKVPEGDALWITAFDRYPKHAWPGTWNNTIFRNESRALSSDLIREAVAVTRWVWPVTPPNGIITFIDREKVRRKRDFGRCYRRAGWHELGETKGGLLVLGLAPSEMPAPLPPVGELVFA